MTRMKHPKEGMKDLLAPRSKYFNSKRFDRIYPCKGTSYPTPMPKWVARRIAEDEREGGRNSRVVKVRGGYAVYSRNK